MCRAACGGARALASSHFAVVPFTAPGESMRSVAAALIIVAGGAVAAGVSARRAAVALGEEMVISMPSFTG